MATLKRTGRGYSLHHSITGQRFRSFTGKRARARALEAKRKMECSARSAKKRR